MHCTQQTDVQTWKFETNTFMPAFMSIKNKFQSKFFVIRFRWIWCGNLKHFIYASLCSLTCTQCGPLYFTEKYIYTHAHQNLQQKWILFICSRCQKFSEFNIFIILTGTYESGIASYKHLYFNATENTMKIWILTVIAIITLYECVKHLIGLMITKSVRYSMIFLFFLSIFSHYYAWWAYVNYYNDDFYSQWNHQMFFTVNFILWIQKWLWNYSSFLYVCLLEI